MREGVGERDLEREKREGEETIEKKGGSRTEKNEGGEVVRQTSLAGQPIRKREEPKGLVSCLAIRDLYRCSQECSPIRYRHVTTNIVELSKYSG